jgi:hypothetical protein
MLSLEDVLKIPPDADENHLRRLGLLPQPVSAMPTLPVSPTPSTASAPVKAMTPPARPEPEMHPEFPAMAPPVGAPAVKPMEPPAASTLTAPPEVTNAPSAEIKPMQLPKLNEKERQALPTTSEGVLPGSSQFYGNEVARIEDKKANPWGSPENHPGFWGKVGHIAAKVGNIAGDVIAPATMANIPGTEMNQRVEENRAEEKEAKAKAAELTEKREGRLEEHEKNVEDVNQKKLDQAQQKIDELENKDKSAREIALRKQGLKLDAQGNAVPLQYEDMSPAEQAVHDLKVVQADSQVAKAALDRFRADPNNPQNQAALQRVRIMAQNAATAAGKLGLDKEKFIADYLGLGPDGNPLPGAAIDPKTGKPIGPKLNKPGVNAEAFVPSIQKSVVQAAATQDSVRRLMKILEPQKDNNEAFGTFWKQVEYKLGKAQADQLGQELAAINLASLQQAGQVMQQLGGTRSIQALNKAMQHTPDPLKDSVMLMYQKMGNIDRSLATFLTEADKYGRKKSSTIEPERMKPVGEGGAAEPPAAAGPPEGKVSVYDPQGNEHFVLKEKKDAFLKDPKYKGWTEKKPETK